MIDSDTPFFPDVLGSITSGERCNIGVMQLALGTRPHVARAGRPFEVLLLAQNVSDTNVDLTAVLQVPAGFATRSARIVVGVGPAEVGYIVLPTSAQANTPAASGYKLAMTVEVKPLGNKPQRVRPAEGGVPADADDLSPEGAGLVAALRDVSFSTAKRFGRNVLETSIDLLSGGIGKIVDFAPGWVSLWTLGDLRDDGALLRRFSDTLRFRVLPSLQSAQTLGPLTEETAKRFAEAGYPLKPPEARVIAKVMALVLEYAMPRESAHNPLTAGIYNVVPLLGGGNLASAPHWFRAMLRALGRDARSAYHAPAVVQRLIYVDLLRDAMMHAFTLIEAATGEDLGTDAERQLFTERLISRLDAHEGVDLVHTYMPLVIGGIMINHVITTPDENLIETMRGMWTVIDERRRASGEREADVLDMADRAAERALETYGYNRRLT